MAKFERHVDVLVILETIMEPNDVWMSKRSVNLNFSIQLRLCFLSLERRLRYNLARKPGSTDILDLVHSCKTTLAQKPDTLVF